jgi:hypothetical protein
MALVCWSIDVAMIPTFLFHIYYLPITLLLGITNQSCISPEAYNISVKGKSENLTVQWEESSWGFPITSVPAERSVNGPQLFPAAVCLTLVHPPPLIESDGPGRVIRGIVGNGFAIANNLASSSLAASATAANLTRSSLAVSATAANLTCSSLVASAAAAALAWATL